MGSGNEVGSGKQEVNKWFINFLLALRFPTLKSGGARSDQEVCNAPRKQVWAPADGYRVEAFGFGPNNDELTVLRDRAVGLAMSDPEVTARFAFFASRLGR